MMTTYLIIHQSKTAGPSGVITDEFKAEKVTATSMDEAVEKFGRVSGSIRVFRLEDGVRYRTKREFKVERV